MSYRKRLKTFHQMADAQFLHEEGNKFFKAGDIESAIACYTQALELGSLKDADKAIIYKNRAACHLKKDNYKDAVKDASSSLDLVPDDPKALYRRCQAYEKLNQTEEAYKDAAALMKVDPQNLAVQPILERLNPVIQEKIKHLKMAALDPDKGNFVRMALLVKGVSTRAVRVFFDREFSPVDLFTTLRQNYNYLLDLKSKRVIHKAQWNVLFPHNGLPESKNFDVRLMISLLRNFTSVSQPFYGYDRLPMNFETTPGADLARIKYYSNYLSHHDSDEIDSAYFNAAWTDISDAIKRLGGPAMYQECMDLKNKPLDQPNHEILLGMKNAETEINNLKQTVDTLQRELQTAQNIQQDPIPGNIRGPNPAMLSQCPSDKHLVRIASRIGMQSFKNLTYHLGINTDDWEDIEYKYDDKEPVSVKMGALWQWRNRSLEVIFRELQKAFEGNEDKRHFLCDVFCEDVSLHEKEPSKLQMVPDDSVLLELTRHIGNCAMHLGIELGLDFSEIEDTISKYRKDIFEQTHDILMKWKKTSKVKTLYILMQALRRAQPQGFNYLCKKYNIELRHKGSKEQPEKKKQGTTYVYDDNDLRKGDCTTIAKYPGIYLFSKHTERSSRRLNSKMERLQEKTSFVDCISCQKFHSLYDVGKFHKLPVDGNSSMEDIINDKSMSDFYRLVLVDCWLHLNKGFIRFSFETCLNIAVKRRKSMVCRLLLCYAPVQVDNWAIVSTLQIALFNNDREITKAIAWYITRRFVKVNAISFENIKDIWPALKCMCNNIKQNNERCSIEIAIIVEHSTGCKPIPENFCSLRVICLADEYPCKNKEGKSKSIGSKHHDEVISEIFSYFHEVDGGIAEDIFIHHSKTTIIGCSPLRSVVSSGRNSSFSEYVVINLFCKLKGYIPVGEKHYPKAINGMKTKVIQGSFAFGSNMLRVGDKIGPADTKELKTGTLGGFVRVRGDLAFLTCCHVIIDKDDLDKKHLSVDDSKKIWVNCYTKDGNVFRCGRLRDVPAFETDNKAETSIDAALITFDSDVEIDQNDFVSGKKENFSALGLKSPYLNDNCVDHKTWCYSPTKPELKVLSVGATSELSCCYSNIRENDKEEVYLFSSLTILHEAVIKEVKEIVLDILKDSFSTLSDDRQKKKKINDKCCNCYSQEIKDHIFHVLDKIISESNDGNSLLETKHQRVEEVVRNETDGKSLSLVNTVHLQDLFLSKSRNRGDADKQERISRQMYNQIHIPNVPFRPGDSGTCVYIVGGPVCGCIGMAIASHPKGGCIATPIIEILQHFKIGYNLSEPKPSQMKTTEETAMDTD